MDKREILSTPLRSIEVEPRPLTDLLAAMGQTGFQGKTLARAVETVRSMVAEPNNLIFLGYSGSMSTTGQWKLIRWLIEQGFVDVLVSTGANVTEDVFEAMGFHYYQGSQHADDVKLLEHQIDRYYDVYADELEYRKMEDLLGAFLVSLDAKRIYSSAELLNEFGKYQAERGIDSITAAAYRQGVPVFSPALADSGFGVAAFQLDKRTGQRIVLDQFRDFHLLGEIGLKAQETSVIYLGGGVPKDTIQLVTVMSSLAAGGEEPVPHRFAVQITTDSPQWGGLSGCTLEEAVSWGKIDAAGDHVTCYCDTTIALPILVHALAESGVKRAGRPDLSWLWEQPTPRLA
jgi:deoxyhypusine synthase